MLKERRKYPRTHSNLPIKIFNPAFDIVTETRNISGNGTYCSVNKDVEPMTKLKVTLLVPVIKGRLKKLKKINCKGVVVRKEETKNSDGEKMYNIGIFFYEIKESDRRLLTAYINSTFNHSSRS